MAHVIDQILFVAVGARTEAETTTEKVSLSIADWTIEVCCVKAGRAVRMTRQTLGANLNESSSTSTDWSYTNKVALCSAFLAIVCSSKARTAFPITWCALIIQSIEFASSKASRVRRITKST